MFNIKIKRKALKKLTIAVLKYATQILKEERVYPIP